MGINQDDVLRDKVQAALDSDVRTRAYALKADVINGEAQINGIVDNLAEKQQVNKIVSNIKGIRGVENGVTISTDGAIDDEDVTFEVMEELNATQNVNLKNVGAKTVKGTVFLMGRVDSPEEKQAAIKAASTARGVRNVVSQLSRGNGEKDLSLEALFHGQVNNDNEDPDRARIF